MTHIALLVGGHTLVCVVPNDYFTGLHGYQGLTDDQGMYFPYSEAGPRSIHMGAVSFPIDIIFLRYGTVAAIVANAQPGDRSIWTQKGCTGVIEVRGGWCADHMVGIGASVQ